MHKTSLTRSTSPCASHRYTFMQRSVAMDSMLSSGHLRAAPHAVGIPHRPQGARPARRLTSVIVARSSSQQRRKTSQGGGQQGPLGDAFGSVPAYNAMAALQAGAAAFTAFAPSTAHDLLFGTPGTQYSDVLFRILSCVFLTGATGFSVQAAAAKAGILDDVVHRRANGSLSFWAASCLCIPAITYVRNPNLYPEPILQTPAAAAFMLSLGLTAWIIAGIDYAKYTEWGANPIKIIQSFVRDFLTVRKFDGLNSGIYSFLTAFFVVGGFSYLFAPVQTLDAIFGTAGPKVPQDLLLWQLIGAGVATAVGPVAFTQREAASENNFSKPNKRTLMAGLAISSTAHTVLLATLLNSERAGPLLFPVGFCWGVSAVASALIAIKPSEDDEKNKIFKG